MHRLLERQLRRLLGIGPGVWSQVAARLSALTPAQEATLGPDLTALLGRLPSLLERIGETYGQQDRDLALIRRSLELSSAELTASNQRLRLEAQSSARALETLRGAFEILLRDTDRSEASNQAGLADMAEQVVALTRERERMREALARSEERFELAMQGSNDGLWDLDLLRGTVYYSPRWKQMIGHKPDEIGASPEEWLSRIHPGDRMASVSALQRCLEGNDSQYESIFRFRHREGHSLWILSRGRVVRDDQGKALRVVGTHTDITAQKEAEAALIRAKEDAERANRLKSEFLANMSHEIRTPMNGVLGMLELALDTALDDKQREYLGLAHISAESLLAIINDILDFSKIEAGRLDIHLEPFSLEELLSQVTRLLLPRCQDQGLYLRLQVDPRVPQRVRGDEARLRQILLNLLGNAIKFTAQGGITLTVRLGGRGVEFRVRDTGIGIPPDKQATIFDAFTQADGSITRRFGGTGLGLSISSRLVSMMHGDMDLESTLGLGSEFRFSLPLPAATTAVPVSRPEHAAQSPVCLRVLLVEDNTINQRLASALLRGMGHQVEIAENGAAALDHLNTHHIDLILMDMQMPVMDGLDATRILRERERTRQLPRCPIIALTANAYAADRERCLLAGMDGYLAKPLRRHELLSAITQVFALYWQPPALPLATVTP